MGSSAVRTRGACSIARKMAARSASSTGRMAMSRGAEFAGRPVRHAGTDGSKSRPCARRPPRARRGRRPARHRRRRRRRGGWWRCVRSSAAMPQPVTRSPSRSASGTLHRLADGGDDGGALHREIGAFDGHGPAPSGSIRLAQRHAPASERQGEWLCRSRRTGAARSSMLTPSASAASTSSIRQGISCRVRR